MLRYRTSPSTTSINVLRLEQNCGHLPTICSNAFLTIIIVTGFDFIGNCLATSDKRRFTGADGDRHVSRLVASMDNLRSVLYNVCHQAYSSPWLTLITTLGYHAECMFNLFAPGRRGFNFSYTIFKLILVTYGWGISGELALRWRLPGLIDEKSTLVQVMVCYHQATTSHFLSQCWPRSMSPYNVTM